MHPHDMTEADRELLYQKIEELRDLYTEIMGGTYDLMCVVHRQHEHGERCNGVFIMNSGDLPVGNAHNMLMQGVILMEGAIIAAQDTPPPGTTLN